MPYFSNIMLATLGTLLVMGGIIYFVLGRRPGAAGKSGVSANPFVSAVLYFHAHIKYIKFLSLFRSYDFCYH